jgi:hypothetical protein
VPIARLAAARAVVKELQANPVKKAKAKKTVVKKVLSKKRK